MFIRFVTFRIDPNSRCAEGIFTASHWLAEEGWLSDYEQSHLQELLDWFGQHLAEPSIFSRAADPGRAICWFKPSARFHLARLWEIVAILENNDFFVRLLKSDTPGRIVYEDDFQIAALPFPYRRFLRRLR